MKKEIKNNSGYTLVELILVIAIILIMSGGAMLTVSAIRSSQATSSMQKFDDEIAALEMKTKSFMISPRHTVIPDFSRFALYKSHFSIFIIRKDMFLWTPTLHCI